MAADPSSSSRETAPFDVEQARRRIAAALNTVQALCNGARWTMSVPARPTEDPDLVIAQALASARDLADQVASLSSRVEHAERANATLTAQLGEARDDLATMTRNRDELMELSMSAVTELRGDLSEVRSQLDAERARISKAEAGVRLRCANNGYAWDEAVRALYDEDTGTLRFGIPQMAKGMPTVFASLSEALNGLGALVVSLPSEQPPAWRCMVRRSHGTCGTSNAADSDSCGACGADRPASEDAMTRVPRLEYGFSAADRYSVRGFASFVDEACPPGEARFYVDEKLAGKIVNLATPDVSAATEDGR